MLKTRLLSMQNLGVNHHENEHSCIVLSMRQLKLKLNLPKWIHFPIFPISARNLWHFSRYRFLPASATPGTSSVKHCSVVLPLVEDYEKWHFSFWPTAEKHGKLTFALWLFCQKKSLEVFHFAVDYLWLCPDVCTENCWWWSCWTLSTIHSFQMMWV